MKILRILLALLLASYASLILAQRPEPAKNPSQPAEPLLVDVHASPYRPSITYTVNISSQRFDIRNATIVNMIDFVHGRADDDGREDNAIVGGPTWIDFDRFDIAAMTPSLKAAVPVDVQPNYGIPPQSPYDKLRPVVERILAERFHLKFHTEDRPLPGFI